MNLIELTIMSIQQNEDTSQLHCFQFLIRTIKIEKEWQVYNAIENC